jgi:MarR family transcriptional regulator, organic hydroperoxide resistance regulator
MAPVRRNTQRSSRATPGSSNPALDFTRLLWAIQHLLNRTSKLLHRQLGITGPQRQVLRIIQEQPGISAGEIATSMHVDKSTLTGVFHRLEQQRLIRRDLDGSDRRRTRFRLGPGSKGVNLIDVPSLESAVAAAFAKTPAKARRSARDVLAVICDRLRRQVTHAASAAKPRHRRRS